MNKLLAQLEMDGDLVDAASYPDQWIRNHDPGHKFSAWHYADLPDDGTLFASVPRACQRGARWVDPRLVAEVTFTTWTADNLLRQPSFEGLCEDKPAKDVRLQRVKSQPEALCRGTCLYVIWISRPDAWRYRPRPRRARRDPPVCRRSIQRHAIALPRP